MRVNLGLGCLQFKKHTEPEHAWVPGTTSDRVTVGMHCGRRWFTGTHTETKTVLEGLVTRTECDFSALDRGLGAAIFAQTLEGGVENRKGTKAQKTGFHGAQPAPTKHTWGRATLPKQGH